MESTSTRSCSGERTERKEGFRLLAEEKLAEAQHRCSLVHFERGVHRVSVRSAGLRVEGTSSAASGIDRRAKTRRVTKLFRKVNIDSSLPGCCEKMTERNQNRRRFLKFLGVSGAGVALANAAAVSKEKLREGADNTKEEIEDLKKAYENLDNRSKSIIRVILMISGLDFFID